MQNDGFDLFASFNNLMKKWWQIVFVLIAGAVIGLIVSYLIPPLYQAEAVFYASIDFTDINFDNLVGQNGQPYKFTQYDEDLALEVVQSVLLSEIRTTLKYAQMLDSEMTNRKFNDSMLIQRYHGQWYLRFRHRNPETAQKIVNYWAENALTSLEKAQESDEMENYVMVDLLLKAQLPQEPTYHLRGVLVMSGTVFGLITGIIMVDFRQRFGNPKKKVA